MMRTLAFMFCLLGTSTMPVWLDQMLDKAIVQLGALGLAYLLVRHLMKQNAQLVQVIEKQQDSMESKDQAVAEALQKSSEAMTRVAEALHDRPCLLGDSRIQKGNE